MRFRTAAAGPLAGEREPIPAFLSMGSNVGERLDLLRAAIADLDGHERVAVVDVSGIYETAPWGGVDQEPFLNCVVAIETTLAPAALLRACQRVEAAHGRDRDVEQRWGPRTLDVDIVLYGDETIDTPDLQVPHPRLRERAFVVVPLLEVWPGGELPDGTRLSRVAADLAPIEGIELVLRLDDVPGRHIARPDGPQGPGFVFADEWESRRPRSGPPPGVER